VRTLPPKMVQVLAPFAPLFSRRVFRHVQVLVAGAILAPGRRTVATALRAMGLDQEKRFHRYHRVLSRAGWSSRKVSRVLLGLLVEAFVPEGSPVVVGIDETLERRYGRKIRARGVYRDPVRSTHETFVKSSGLRWVCAMLLVEIPLASRVWALPFLSPAADGLGARRHSTVHLRRGGRGGHCRRQGVRRRPGRRRGRRSDRQPGAQSRADRPGGRQPGPGGLRLRPPVLRDWRPGRAAAVRELDHDRARRSCHPPGLRGQTLRPVVVTSCRGNDTRKIELLSGEHIQLETTSVIETPAAIVSGQAQDLQPLGQLVKNPTQQQCD
jgi:hypothetical protein